MVCHGPDPPDNSPHELTPPSRAELLMNGPNAEESDEEQLQHFGYEPLPQGPEAIRSEHDSDDDVEDVESQQVPPADVPSIEPMAAILTRQVWNPPRATDPIVMDSETIQQIMNAMANFSLPSTAIPEWAQSITEEQWIQTLSEKIQQLRDNR